MSKLVLNGEVVEEGDAVVSALDYGLLYGYGLFESLHAVGGVVFRLGRHLRRLRDSAAEILLPVPWSDSEIEGMVCDTLQANNLSDAYVRVTVTSGAGEPRLGFTGDAEPTIIVLARKLPEGMREKQSAGIRLTVSRKYVRCSTDFRSKIKSTNYLVSALARKEALDLGVDDVVLLNERGGVAECSTSNVFIVRDGVLITPPVSAGVLPGITREAVIEVAGELGVSVEEKDVTVEELADADEVFTTNSIMGVVPAVELDGKKLGDGKPGEITLRLQEEYKRLVEEETKR